MGYEEGSSVMATLQQEEPNEEKKEPHVLNGESGRKASGGDETFT